MQAQQIKQTEKAFWRRCLPSLFFVTILLSLCLVACGRGTTSFNSSCPPAATSSVVRIKAVPPPNTPTPTPTPVLPVPTPPPTATPAATVPPTPTQQTPETPEEEARHFGLRYVKLAITREFLKLYNLLSSGLRDSMSYEQFSHDPNYVLSDGPACWRENDSDMILSSPDGGQTWDIGMPMTQVSCTDGSTMATYDWHLRVLIPQDGPPVVIQAGLYPTGN